MKILVTVPVKNNLKFTQLLVDDVKRDTDANLIDFLIIDNGSTDGTQKWCKDNNINMVEFEASSCAIYEMWNMGLKYAKDNEYEYVGIFNNDIHLPSGWWGKCLKIFENENIAGIYPAFTFGDFVGFKEPVNTYRKPVLAPYGEYGFTGFCQIYRTGVQNLIGYYDEGYDLAWGDVDYARRCLASKLVLVYTNEIQIHHYSSQTLNVEHRVSQRCKKDTLKYLSKWKIESEDEEYKKNNIGRFI